jgi:hypothetical protein
MGNNPKYHANGSRKVLVEFKVNGANAQECRLNLRNLHHIQAAHDALGAWLDGTFVPENHPHVLVVNAIDGTKENPHYDADALTLLPEYVKKLTDKEKAAAYDTMMRKGVTNELLAQQAQQANAERAALADEREAMRKEREAWRREQEAVMAEMRRMRDRAALDDAGAPS